MWRYVILILACAMQAQAQTTVGLRPVVVTATGTEQPAMSVAVPTVVISARDLERSGSATIAQALQDNLPGLVFTPDAMGNNMRLRGLTTRYVLILVDGARMAPEGAGGNVNLERVAVADVERIEVVTGSGAALWGAGAVGGVVNIITKRGEGISVAIAAGDHNVWRGNVSAGESFGDWKVRGSVWRNSSGEVEGVVDTSPYTDWGGSTRIGWSKKRVGIEATGRMFSHETFNSAGVLNTTHRLTHSWAAGVEARYGWENNTLRLDLDTDNYLDYTIMENRNDRRQRDNRTSLASLRLLDHHVFGERTELTSGAEFDHEESFATTTMGPAPTTRTLDNAAIFAQAEWHAGVDLTLGARYTHSSQFGNAFTPGISALWHGGRWHLRAGVGTSFRPPSIKELHYDFDHQGMFWIYGNPLLRPERGVFSHFAVQYCHSTLDISATLYHNDIRNKITQYEIAGEQHLELHYLNVGRAVIRGVDVEAAYGFGQQFMLRGAYSLCDSRDKQTNSRLDSSPLHSATGSLTWSGFVTAQAGMRFLSNYTYLTSTGTTVRAPSCAVWRVTVSRGITGGLGATLRIDNIFDTPTLSDPIGRQISIELKYTL